MNCSESSVVPTRSGFLGLCPANFQGLQWCLLKEDEVVACILAMEGHRGRSKSLQLQCTDDPFHSHHWKRPPSVGETEMANAASIKLQRKLEAQGKIPPSSVALRILTGIHATALLT